MISIITVTYNSEKTVRKAIESVVNQTYPDVEYIIVDGGSNDDTVRIAREYNREYTGRNGVDRIISEPDDGIYDAMNKGIRLAQGGFIGLLNSDDCYKEETVLGKVVDAFKKHDADIVFGDIEMVNDTGEVIRRWSPGEYEKGSFFRGWHPPHPGLFVSKQFYEKIGLYQTDMQVAADFEFMLRAFEKNDARAVYLNEPLVVMSHGGISTGGVKGIVTGNREILRGFHLNGYDPPPLYTVRRFLSKVKQYIA